ncbi:MAG: glycosyltransferase family 2 protein [Bacteroidales bacterium]|nr:glycosyltransferase family 2 protein [Bacteroidales bacterium]
MKTTLLIATYNWPEALKLVLESVFRQTVLPDEIVIADDGSGPETKALIDAMRNRSPIPITHVWHEDDGFRLTVIRNKAVAASKGDYILQIDGDCILPTHYVEDHINMAKPGYYAGGKRIRIKEEWTKKTFERGKLYLPYFGSLFQPKGIKKFARLHRIPFLMKPYSWLRSRSKRPHRGIIGCSMDFWKEDFIKVNGYDETFIGWGHEDAELLARLYSSGLKKCVIHLGGFVYHLEHKSRALDSEQFRKLERHLQESIEKKRVWAENGVDKYL